MIIILSVVWAVESQTKNRQRCAGGLQTDILVLIEINATFFEQKSSLLWIAILGTS